MARTYKTVVGPVTLPDGTVPVNGRIIFTLSSWDKEPNESVYIPGPLSVPLDSSGNFSCNLFSNNVGENSTVYKVSVIHGTDRETIVETYIATVALSGTGTVKLSNLDMVPEWTPNTVDVLALCLAAEAGAESAQVAAAASAVAAQNALTATLDVAGDVEAIADGARIWEEVGDGGKKVLAAETLEDLGGLVSIGQTYEQITISANGYVIDAGDFDKILTVFTGGANWVMDARGIAAERSYTVRVYGNVGYSLHIDFGPDVVISGWTDTGHPATGVTLIGGQTVTFQKAAEGYIYISGVSDPVFRTEIPQASPLYAYYEPTKNGEYRFVRRVAINAGLSLAITPPSVFAGKSYARGPEITSLVTHMMGAGPIVTCHVVGSPTDTSVTIRNPNSEQVHVTFVLEGLRLTPPDETTPTSHFRNVISRMRNADAAPRTFCAIGAGQSLAEAGANRPRYRALSDYLRDSGDIVAPAFMDWVNVAWGGSVADLASSPGTTNYWRDVAGNANGPRLTAALASISAAVAAGKTIRFLSINLGQADAIGVGNGINAIANYKTAMNSIINQLAAAMPGTAKLYLELIAGRSETHGAGTQAVREAQLEIAASNANVDGVIDGYDVPLEDTVHPTYAGYRIYGTRTGMIYKGAYAPPQITAAVKSGGKITLTVDAINLSKTPVNTILDYAGVKTASGYIQAHAKILSSTSIELTAHPLSGAPNLDAATHVAWPLLDYPILSDGPFAVGANGLPIKSVLRAL